MGAKFASCNNRIYLFGGERGNMEGTLIPNCNMTRLQVNLDELTIEFVELKCGGKSPCPRTAHAMASIGGEYVMVVGGQSIQ